MNSTSKLTSKVTKSITKLTDSIANGTNSTANSTANGMNSIAKVVWNQTMTVPTQNIVNPPIHIFDSTS